MTFASVKLYCLITLISRIAQLVLTRPAGSIVSVQVRIFSLNMRDVMIYAERLWERYLSKLSLIKHTYVHDV